MCPSYNCSYSSMFKHWVLFEFQWDIYSICYDKHSFFMGRAGWAEYSNASESISRRHELFPSDFGFHIRINMAKLSQ